MINEGGDVKRTRKSEPEDDAIVGTMIFQVKHSDQ